MYNSDEILRSGGGVRNMKGPKKGMLAAEHRAQN